MNTQSLTKHRSFWKFLAFCKSHRPSTPVSLPEDSLEPSNASDTEHRQALHQVHKNYTLERRNFL